MMKGKKLDSVAYRPPYRGYRQTHNHVHSKLASKAPVYLTLQTMNTKSMFDATFAT